MSDVGSRRIGPVGAQRRVGVGVLVSGAGTNLRALIEASRSTEYPAEVVQVLSNRPSAGALLVARDAGIPAEALPIAQFGGDGAARDAALRDRLLAGGVQLLVCAGYDRIIGQPLVAAFPDAILNIHPSLLPAFAGGMHAVEDALAHGVKVSGCTVHLIDPGVPDGGPIVLQGACPVLEDDDAETLRRRIHEQEWRLLPEAVALWCAGRLELRGRRVVIQSAGASPRVGGGAAGLGPAAISGGEPPVTDPR